MCPQRRSRSREVKWNEEPQKSVNNWTYGRGNTNMENSYAYDSEGFHVFPKRVFVRVWRIVRSERSYMKV